MSVWFIILAGTAFGGAMVLWSAVSRTKHLSEGMLKQYGEMLAAAREQRTKELIQATEAADDESAQSD